MFKTPPYLGELILKSFLDRQNQEYLIGDIDEIYFNLCQEKGHIYAYFWYWLQVLKSIPGIFYNSVYWSFVMIKNYIKTALRSAKKQKLNTAVNIFGLAIGLAFTILVVLYTSHEYSYESFHEKKDSIFSVNSIIHHFNAEGHSVPFPFARAFKENFPEVDSFIRIRQYNIFVTKYEDRIFSERPLMADPEFFSFFSFKLLKGESGTVLQDKNSIILTQSTAQKYFGDEDPLGKTMSLTYGGERRLFTVTGISEDNPVNSSIWYNVIINIANYDMIEGPDFETSWRGFRVTTFVTLKGGVSVKDLSRRVSDFIDSQYELNNKIRYDEMQAAGRANEEGKLISAYLQSINDIHFSPEIWSRFRTNSKNNLNILAMISLLVLTVACINYLNLTISGSSLRVTEIGIRKVFGADRKNTIRQFVGESIVMCGVAAAGSLVIVLLLIPVFNNLLNSKLDYTMLFELKDFALLSVTVITVGFISGIFPSIVLSRFHPAVILKGKFNIGGKNRLTKSLLVFQYAISILLLISMLVMGKQFKFLQSRELGFDKENLLTINIYEQTNEAGEKVIDLYNDKIGGYHSVLSVSGCRSSFNKFMEYGLLPNNDERDNRGYSNRVYYDFLKTAGVKLLQGRDFSRDHPSDRNAVIVNQKFLELTGIDDPLGKEFNMVSGGFPDFKIIGVVENYHVMSLDNDIPALMLYMFPGTERVPVAMNYILVRITGDNVSDTMAFLERTWKSTFPDKPFSYSFVDEDLNRSFYSFRKWNDFVDYSAILAMIITGIGMFCLTSLIVSRRIKEIGIRKVLGASLFQIYNLVIKEFTLLVLLSILLAMPAAYFVMDRWMQNFAFRAGIDWIEFLLAGSISLIIAVITVSYRAIRAANSNPVDSLKYE